MKINSFTDLDVYQRSYKSAVVVSKELVPFLRSIKEFTTADQLSRCTKAIPALIAEGHAKRHQQKNFQKYLDDALGESNESIVHISMTDDLGHPAPELCKRLTDEYTIICKQLYNLGKSWSEMKRRNSTDY